jgi:hypothetical protein
MVRRMFQALLVTVALAVPVTAFAATGAVGDDCCPGCPCCPK